MTIVLRKFFIQIDFYNPKWTNRLVVLWLRCSQMNTLFSSNFTCVVEMFNLQNFKNYSILKFILLFIYFLMYDKSKWFASITTPKKYEMIEFVCCSFRSFMTKSHFNKTKKMFCRSKDLIFSNRSKKDICFQALFFLLMFSHWNEMSW